MAMMVMLSRLAKEFDLLWRTGFCDTVLLAGQQQIRVGRYKWLEAEQTSLPAIEQQRQLDGMAQSGTTPSGVINGQRVRNYFDIDGGVNRCSVNYIGGRVVGTVFTTVAFMRGARPNSLTHYTTPEGAIGIAQSGSIRPSRGGFFGGGRYASSIGPFPRNIFVPRKSTEAVIISDTSGYLRVAPGTFLQPTAGGYVQISIMATLYGSGANVISELQGDGCGC